MNVGDSVNVNLRDRLDAARRQVEKDRTGSLAALNDIFSQGVVPDSPLNGRYRGELVVLSWNQFLDFLGDAIARMWFPWQGKMLDAATQTGDNIFSDNIVSVGRLLWSGYSGYIPDGDGRVRAFKFRTYTGAGKLDPDIQVFKIDYDSEENPTFFIRDILDELRQIDSGYYLGKALLRDGSGNWSCVAYFTLSS